MSWLYEFNGHENWITCDDEYDTKEAAIDAGREFFREEAPDEDYFDVGEKCEVIIPSISADWILDNLNENMYDQAGEYAEDWLMNIPIGEQRVLEERLNEVLVKWLEETNNMPKFWTVRNIHTIQIEE